MFDPSQIILMTGAWDTLKNDDYKTIGGITVPGSVSIPAGGRQVYMDELDVGQHGSVSDIRVVSSKIPDYDFVLSGNVQFTRTGTDPFGSATYTIFPISYFLTGSTVRVEIQVPNPYLDNLTGESGNETFTFKIRTYKAPF